MIIISGNSRSGTTMMGRILGNNPEVFTFQELHFFDELVPQELLFKKLPADELARIYARLMAVQRNGYFGSRDVTPYLEEAAALVVQSESPTPAAAYKLFLQKESKIHKASLPCEQTPQNIFALDVLFQIFPQARAVIMMRDPREVMLSQKNKWKRRHFTKDAFPLSESIRAFLNYHPVTMSRIWHAAATTAQNWQHDKRVLIVKFENLVDHPEKTVREICAHCHIDFSTSMLEIPVVGSSNANDSARKGIDNNRSGKWRKGLHPAEVHICQKINLKLMQQWGYDPEPVSAGPLSVAWYTATMPLKLALSLPFNLKRLKNPGALWRRLMGK
jgi:omega-hydroxy-beta-dihydromenaquinone-9 sulfotransferase